MRCTRRARRSRKASIPGGGVTLLRAAAVDRCAEARRRRSGRRRHPEARAEEPLRQLVAQRWPRRQRRGRAPAPRRTSANWGFDVMTREYVDLVKAGHHRPGQGHPQRAGERRQRGGHDPDHRSAGDRHAREEGPRRALQAAARTCTTSVDAVHAEAEGRKALPLFIWVAFLGGVPHGKPESHRIPGCPDVVLSVLEGVSAGWRAWFDTRPTSYRTWSGWM